MAYVYEDHWILLSQIDTTAKCCSFTRFLNLTPLYSLYKVSSISEIINLADTLRECVLRKRCRSQRQRTNRDACLRCISGVIAPLSLVRRRVTSRYSRDPVHLCNESLSKCQTQSIREWKVSVAPLSCIQYLITSADLLDEFEWVFKAKLEECLTHE